MENIILIIVFAIIILGLFIMFVNRKNSNKNFNIDEKTKEQTISQMKNIQRGSKINSNVTTKKSGIFDQKPNPIVREKAMSWTTSSSYEEDLKSVAIDKNDKNIINEIDKTSFKPQILLVDDSLVVRTYVGNLLQKYNYDVILKNDGWEAITYLNGTNQKPELIISDIEMPNMNGIQLIDEIRKEKRFNNIPILVISAYAENHLVLMESEKIQGFITKPFKDEDLINQMTYLLGN